MSPVRAPLRSMRVLVKRVVACTTRSTAPGSRRSAARSPATPSSTPRAGSSWVVRTFRARVRPSSRTTMSVNVPPMSIPSDHMPESLTRIARQVPPPPSLPAWPGLAARRDRLQTAPVEPERVDAREDGRGGPSSWRRPSQVRFGSGRGPNAATSPPVPPSDGRGGRNHWRFAAPTAPVLPSGRRVARFEATSTSTLQPPTEEKVSTELRHRAQL